MLHGVSSKKSQIGRCKQYALGRLKKAVSAKQDNRARQSHKGRLETKYIQSGMGEKMESEQISAGQNIGPNIGTMMKQPTFDWDTEDKYNELKNFRLEVYNVFKSCDMPDIEKTALIKNWLGRKGLQIIRNTNSS